MSNDKHLDLINLMSSLDSFFEEKADNSQTLENRYKALEMLDKMREKKEEEIKEEIVPIPIKSLIEEKVEKDLNDAVKRIELDLEYPKEESVYYKPDKYRKERAAIFAIIFFCLNLYILKDMNFSTYSGFINTFYRTIPNFLWVNIAHVILLIGCDIYFSNRKAD